MYFADALTLDTGRPVTGGFVAYRAKAARVGHYEYSGLDVDPDNKFGLRDQEIVKVARYSEDVHDQKSAHSFIGKPITDDHPRDAVTRDNWRDHARGTVMGAKWEEGGYLAFDLMLTDGTAIDKVAAGKRELSNGYSCDLVHGDFTATDGVACQFKQTNIRGNHVAIVDRGRAGAECAIRDGAMCSSAPANLFDSLPKFNDQEKPVKTMLIDGLTVDMANADTAIATVQTLIAARDAATKTVTDHVATIATKDRELATKDGEIATLKAKVEDEATLDARADAKAELVTRGKALLGDAMPDVKGKSLADTRRAIVLAVTKDAKLADKSDDYIEARFDGLATKDASTVHPIIAPVVIGDAAATANAAREAMIADMHKTTTVAA